MRLIDADALELRVEKFEQLTGMKLDIVHDFVSSAPTIDAVSVVHGHYIKGRNGEWYCSECKRIDDKYSVAKFCWYCGAKMDGERKTND